MPTKHATTAATPPGWLYRHAHRQAGRYSAVPDGTHRDGHADAAGPGHCAVGRHGGFTKFTLALSCPCRWAPIMVLHGA